MPTVIDSPECLRVCVFSMQCCKLFALFPWALSHTLSLSLSLFFFVTGGSGFCNFCVVSFCPFPLGPLSLSLSLSLSLCYRRVRPYSASGGSGFCNFCSFKMHILNGRCRKLWKGLVI
uniref:Secreted protein n=1 Tax=Heterorhabditis bacteriophora TaxID=37862 RepID=A0A1I7W6T2_HETBA